MMTCFNPHFPTARWQHRLRYPYIDYQRYSFCAYQKNLINYCSCKKPFSSNFNQILDLKYHRLNLPNISPAKSTHQIIVSLAIPPGGGIIKQFNVLTKTLNRFWPELDLGSTIYMPL